MIQFISHYTDQYSYLDSIRMALEGGCRWIQLRMKGITDGEVRPVALEARRMCKEAGATFILDDRVMLAKEIGADGVHLGKNDMPVAEARNILGTKAIIGGTANTYADLKAHYEASANYIGCGPFRFTTTKERLAPILGLEGYVQIISQMKADGIDIPIVAIGGITAVDIPLIMKTGVKGIAISGAVLHAENPVESMKQLLEIITT